MADQKTSIGRVVAGVVDVQQTMALQFDALSKGLESLKLEYQSGISQLREDIRRSDDRATKQIADLNSLHNKEMERLHQIIHTLLTRETAAPTLAQIPIQQQQQQQQQMQQALFLQRQMEMAQAQAMAQLINAGGVKPGMPVAQPMLPTPTQQIKPPQQLPASVIANIPKITPDVVIPPATAATTAAPTPVAPAVKPLFPAQTTVTPAAPASTSTSIPEKPKTITTTTTPFSFGSGSTSIFGKKPDAQPLNLTPVAKPAQQEEDDEEHDEDYEPQATFEPVIPLPDLVDVKTGEEDEEVVFNNRSKLYIFTNETNEWKERGTGELKVLLNKETNKYRVVMRRDQVTISEEALPSNEKSDEELCWRIEVLKVCANFPIVGSMSIQQHAKNEKAYTWFCEDFSEEEENDHKGTLVKLSARFATVDIAVEFKSLFEKAVAAHKGSGTIDKEIKSVEVKKEAKQEIKEEVVIPANSKENGFGDKFKPKAGSWECTGCYVTCKPEETVCACCGTNKDGSAGGEKNIFSKPSILQPAPGTPKVTFGFSASAATTAKPSPAAAFGASLNGSPSTANTSIFGGGTPKTATTTSFFTPKTTTTPATATPSFNFNKTASPAPAGNALFGGGVKTEAPSFSFKPSEANVPKPTFSFGSKPDTATGVSSTTTDKPEPVKSVFGSSFTTGNESFASMAAKASSNASSIFDSDRAQKAQAELASQKKTSIFGSKPTATAANTSTTNNDEEGDDGEYEPEVEFKPVCPLPDLVEVRTGEEDEEVVFTARCKLFKYHTDLKENKERGVGDIKVLKSSDNKYRVVMRREQVHKLCANFRIEKTMRLEPKANLPQVLTFMCQDYSEDLAKADNSIFTVKFKDESIAGNFKKAVEDAQATM